MARKSTAEVLKNDDIKLGPIEIPVQALHTIEATIAGSGESVLLQNKITEREKDIILGNGPGGQRDHGAQSKYMREKGWKERMHTTVDGKVGHPAEGFLKAMKVSIGKNYVTSKGVKLMHAIDVNRNVTVEGDAPGSVEQGMLVVFTKGKVGMHTHWAQLKMTNTPVPLYRPGISNWEARLRITYNPNVFAPKDILSLLITAGRSIGVGAYRPEKGGTYGTFSLVSAQLVAK